MDYDDLPGVQLITDPRECGIGTKISRPKRSMRPLVEGLRFNHFKHDGKFDTTAKRNLIQDLFLCLSGFEDLWTDPNDPTYGKACFKAYDFHRVGLSDEDFGIPTPFSVRALQIKQERGNRITHGEDAPPLQRPRYGRKCGKIIPRMASFYTCKTCFHDISSLLCTDCFQHGNHEGHDVTFRTNYNFAPVCDCGAADLYKTHEDGHHPHSCKDHPRISGSSQQSHPKWNAGSTDSPDVTEEFERALYDVFVACIEYVIEVFQVAPPPENYSKLPKDLKEMTTAWGINYTCLDDAAKRAEGPWSVAIFADERHSEPELLRQMQHATGADFDDCSDWMKEMDTLVGKRPWSELTKQGRKVVMTVPNPTVAFFLANMFQQIDVPVSLRHAYDMYRESAASTILEWLADICECHVGGDPDLTTKIMSQVLREDRHQNSGGHRVAPDLRRLLKASEGKPDQPRSRIRLDWMWHIDNRLWKQPKLLTKAIYAKMMTVHPSNMEFMLNRFSAHYVSLAQEYLMAERDSDSSIYQFFAYSLFSDGSAVAMAIRKRGLLITMIEVLEAWYRHMPGDFRDRIPVPAQGRVDSIRREVHLRVIGHKNKKGIYLLAHLRGILMLDKVAQQVATSHNLISRLGQFMDIFIGMQPQAHEIVSHIGYEVDWYKGFALMAELAKTLRQLGECYQKADLQLVQDIVRFLMCRIIYDIQLRSDTLDPERYVEPEFRELLFTYGDDEYDSKTPWNFIQNQLHGIEAFSFHHYNHFLLGEMIHSLVASLAHADKTVDFPKYMANLVDTCDNLYVEWSGMPGVPRAYNQRTQQMMLLVIEQPLSKYIVARHIRAERWRRNGSTMRHQLNAYVDTQRREATADQEFFILQTALCTMGPVPFVLAAMDRFGAMDDSPINANYMGQFEDPPGTVIDFEDFIWFLIYLVTDTDRPMQTHPESIVSRTISQLLAIKPMTFAELAKRISDRANERVELSSLVRQMADYRGPTETAPGIYTLKPEYIPHVSPFWRHYSRNERKEVMDFLLKKTFETRPDRSVPFDQWFHIPGRVELPEPDQPFGNLPELWRSPIAIYVLQVTFHHCVLMESDNLFTSIGFRVEDIPRFDSLFDIALHFATLAIHHEPEEFAHNALSIVGTKMEQDEGYVLQCPYEFARFQCLYENLWYMEVSKNPGYKPYRARIKYLTERIRETLDEEEQKRHEKITEARSTPSGRPSKTAAVDKTTAADRQKQVMAEFAKKQAAFAANMDFGDDDDEDIEEQEEGKLEVEHGPCIVCQDPLSPDRPGGMLALFQPSRMVRESVHDVDFFAKSLRTPTNLDNATRSLDYADLTERSYDAQKLDSHPPQSMRLGCYVSGCGHYMHESCMEQYSDHTRSRHSHQINRNQPENIVRYEYMCPLCKSISNFILPIDFEATPVGAVKIPENKEGGMLTLLEYIRMVSAEGLKYINDSTKIWQHHSEGGHVKAWYSDYAFRGNKDARHNDMKQNSLMVDRFRHLYRALADQSHQLRGSSKPFYAPEDAVGYTVSVLEIAQRGLARGPGQLTVAEQLLDSSRNVVKRMLEMLKLELDGYFGKSYNQAGLRVAIFARFLPDWYRASSLPTSLLLRNPLSIVVECAALAPDLLHPVIIMAYYAEVIRVLISISIMARRLVPGAREDKPKVDDPFLYENGAYTDQARARFSDFLPTAITLFRNATPYNDVDATLRAVPDALLSKLIYMHTLPFVRRAAILYYTVHGKYVITDPKDIITEGCEYDRLASLLAIPNPKDTLGDTNNTVELPMVLRWLTQWATGGRQVTSPEICGPYELLSLPEHLDEMILRYSDDVCQRCTRTPQFPGLCLTCGEVICIGGDCCADDDLGECNLHMQHCGAATNLFVDVKRGALIALYAGTGTFLPLPYLDQHGDADGGGQKRGHRLILNEQRYEDIRRNVWLNLSIPHIIARKLEAVSDPGGWSAL